jgi:hypothetical protein
MIMPRTILVPLFLFLSWSITWSAAAQIIVPVQDQSQVDVTVSVDVQFVSAANLYTYNYLVTSNATSAQELEAFSIEANAEFLNIQSPQGWSPGMYFEKPILDWAAVESGPLPPDYVDVGNVLPSPANILPGETLGGFSFQSPEPPTTVVFYARGFAPIPSAVSEDDFDSAGIEIPTALLPRPVTMVVRFGVNGEAVDTSTFHAELNMVAVTGSFTPTGNADELLAVFDLADSPLVLGRNVLATSVEGTVPGATRSAADTDRLTFFVD